MKHSFIFVVFITIILKRNYLYALATNSELLQDSFENHRTKRQGDTCTLPHISNGIVNILRQKTSSNAPASSYLLLNVTCDHNYILYPPNNNIILCINGFWDQEIPQCIQCGQRLDKTHKPFIVNGTLSKFGDFPWHVGIYRKDSSDSDPVYLCGGSLINEHSVLTVAHCFTDESGKYKESSKYFVAAGKYYSSYNNDKDKYAQKREAHRIDIHPRYKGYFTNYAWDIAVVIVYEPFEISNLVQPICVDWTNDFENEQLIPNNNGEVAGWGSTETNIQKATHELRVLKVPFIKAEICTNLVPKTFIRYITPDKFCAGYTNGSSVCGGDSGSGLVFQREKNRDTRYYIRGLVSVGVQIDGRCDDYKYSTYTKVSEYLSFIRESIAQPLLIATWHEEVKTTYSAPIVPCLTPNGEHAKCISIYECQIFVDALKNNPTPESQKFMQDSQCGGGDKVDVCCGSTISVINSNPVTTKQKQILPEPGNCGIQEANLKIFGGTKVELDEFPWMALLEFGPKEKPNITCGGTLISSRFVLTAGHCVQGPTPARLGGVQRIRLGEYNLRNETDCIWYIDYTDCTLPIVRIDVETVVVHENFVDNSLTREHDIAIIKMKNDAETTDFVRPICLPSLKIQIPEKFIVAGWGSTEISGQIADKVKAKVSLFDKSNCTNMYEKLLRDFKLGRYQTCAGDVIGKDSCIDDSGGPLMAEVLNKLENIWYQFGIMTFRQTPCGKPYPTVYTLVSEYVPWIQNQISKL